ncbi:XAP5-domain-containing protein [Atractiella rhizophila]|nr:XAP5-domain-containing protein [Atractiella rhizophila]
MSASQSEKSRQAALEKKRADFLTSVAQEKQRIISESSKDRTSAARFVGQNDSMEEVLKKGTVGLVHLDSFKAVQEELQEQKRREAAGTDLEALRREEEAERAKMEKKRKKEEKRKKKSNLSFDTGEEVDSASSAPSKPKRDLDPVEETPEDAPPVKKLKKNPNVDTSFLPDREREAKERAIKEELRLEFLANQELIKAEPVEITYSYWDGSGHRKSVMCTKGDTISNFLEKCRAQFPELRNVSVDNLMYIKEDLIIPHHYKFYDFILNKYRGKSGPLFNFDVHDDVRLMADATMEKDESHAGKVVEKSWYNRNKHIFPASRWEVFHPDKDYGKYTIA